MGVFDRQIATAARLLKKYGKQVDLVRSGAAVVPDPDAPHRVEEGPDERTAIFAVFQAFETERVDGSQILRNDEKAFIPSRDAAGVPLTFIPDRGMFIDRGDRGIWSIENVSPVAPNDEQIMYELQIRQQSRNR